jgi:hypothetical protein
MILTENHVILLEDLFGLNPKHLEKNYGKLRDGSPLLLILANVPERKKERGPRQSGGGGGEERLGRPVRPL